MRPIIWLCNIIMRLVLVFTTQPVANSPYQITEPMSLQGRMLYQRLIFLLYERNLWWRQFGWQLSRRLWPWWCTEGSWTINKSIFCGVKWVGLSWILVVYFRVSSGWQYSRYWLCQVTYRYAWLGWTSTLWEECRASFQWGL